MRYLKTILICSVLCGVAPLFAHVELDYPQGSESFFAGSLVTIQWHISIPHDTENWDLYISYDGGENYSVLILNLPLEQLTYDWNVPYIASEQTRIKVVQDNIMDIDYMDHSLNFTIVVPPQDGPEFEMQAQDITIDCNEDTQVLIDEWLEEHGGAIAVGTCGDLTWTHNFTELNNGCGNAGDTLVTFSVSDDCGINTTTARLTIVDITPPLMEMDAQMIILQSDCGDNLETWLEWLNNHGGAIASDECSDVSWSYNYDAFVPNCGSTGEAYVTFIASDACENVAYTIAAFITIDTITPFIYAQAQDTTVECDGSGNTVALNYWLNAHGGALGFDGCSDLTWTNNFSSISNDCGNTGTALISFDATDACGNSSSTTASFTIHDSSPPVILTSAGDTIIDCNGDNPTASILAWLSLHGGAQAVDICGNVIWAHDLISIPNQCDETFSRVVVFTATDDCGNASTTQATLELADLTGISDIDKKSIQLNVFPNPANGEFQIAIEKEPYLFISLSLVDVMGTRVWDYSGSQTLITVPTIDFASGLYLIEARTEKDVVTHNVIVR